MRNRNNYEIRDPDSLGDLGANEAGTGLKSDTPLTQPDSRSVPMPDQFMEDYKRDVVEGLIAENARLRAALQTIADMVPATSDITLAHAMAQEAESALAVQS